MTREGLARRLNVEGRSTGRVSVKLREAKMGRTKSRVTGGIGFVELEDGGRTERNYRSTSTRSVSPEVMARLSFGGRLEKNLREVLFLV